jgi:hypothetical protein
MNRSILLFTLFLVFSATGVGRLCAQTPTDDLMMDKGQICVALTYTHDAWDEYWEGALQRKNGNIGTLTRQTIMPMFSLGITDRINVLAALPWVKTEASGGQLAGVQGIQDFGVWAKVHALHTDIGPGEFNIFGVVGLTAPASNYLADYMPLNLGLGCAEGIFRGIFQYRFDQGPYVHTQAGYHLRGNTEIERDYYYTTHGVYSNEINMPNAVDWDVVVGSWLLENSLKLEVRMDGLTTLSGHDIRRQDTPFPSNRMVSTRIGGGGQYFLPFVKGLSVIANGGYVISGRNVGQSTYFTGGLAYQFGLWNTANASTINAPTN